MGVPFTHVNAALCFYLEGGRGLIGKQNISCGISTNNIDNKAAVLLNEQNVSAMYLDINAIS